LAGEVLEPAGDMLALMEGSSAPPPECSVEFDQDPVKTGYTLPRDESTVSRTVVATVVPAEMAESVVLEVTGTVAGKKRVELVDIVVNAEAGTITFKAKGKFTTPVGETDATMIRAVVDGDECGAVKAIVVVPFRIRRDYPQVTDPTLTPVMPENVAIDEKSTPAVPKVRDPFKWLVTTYGHVLTIGINDQFDNELDDLYEGADVQEKFARKGDEYNINRKLDAEGTYGDPVGVINWGPIVHKSAAGGWPMADPLPMPLGVQKQDIRVLVGGHQLKSGIKNRRVTSKIVEGVHHVEIKWPTPQQ
jgi:hypothetical protein